MMYPKTFNQFMSFSITSFYKMYKNTCAECYSEYKEIPLSDTGHSEAFQKIFSKLYQRLFSRLHSIPKVEKILLSMIFETCSLFHTLEGDLVPSLALGSG